jgi:hypothetical protein
MVIKTPLATSQNENRTIIQIIAKYMYELISV